MTPTTPISNIIGPVEIRLPELGLRAHLRFTRNRRGVNVYIERQSKRVALTRGMPGNMLLSELVARINNISKTCNRPQIAL